MSNKDDEIKKITRHDFIKNHILGRNVDSYLPFYDEFSDYNTNAKSYYDYLARFNRIIALYYDLINRLLRRDLEVEDTKTIEFIKLNDWIDNGECLPDNFDDVIKLLANVKVSNETENYTIEFRETTLTLENAITIKNDGIFAPDYKKILDILADEILNIYDSINNLYSEVNNIKNALQKIIDNLYNSGAITNNNINNFEFKTGRNIATGNINLFGGTEDGTSFIRTNSGQTENDITAGI